MSGSPELAAHSLPDMPSSGHTGMLGIPPGVSSVHNSSCSVVDEASWQVPWCLRRNAAWGALGNPVRGMASHVRYPKNAINGI